MNASHRTPAVTSLPQAPQDEARVRERNYYIRMLCFALTVLITPYGWYTWVFAIGAAVLPYIAVVFANAIIPTPTSSAESPTLEISSRPDETAAEQPATPPPTIVMIQETPPEELP